MTDIEQTAKAQEIILALLEHHSQEKAAASLNMCPATLRRWLDKPEFQALYLRARRDRYWLLRARAQQAAPAAVQTLLELMADKSSGAAAQFRACRSVLLRANTFRFEQGQVSAERNEQIYREDTEYDFSPYLPPEALSESPCEVEETARKAGASADKINQIVLAMVQHGGNRAKAAVACGMSPVTIWRWMQKPEVQEQYRKEIRAAYLRAKALLQHTADMAFSIIERIMHDPKAPATVRLRIIEFVIDFGDLGAGEDLHERNEVLIKAKKEFEQLA